MSTSTEEVLIFADPGRALEWVHWIEKRFGVKLAQTPKEAETLLAENTYGALVVDLDASYWRADDEKKKAVEWLGRFRKSDRSTEIVLLGDGRSKIPLAFVPLGIAAWLHSPIVEAELMPRLEVCADRSRRLRLSEVLKERTLRDSGVPQVYSRGELYSLIEDVFEKNERDVGLIFFDIDRFKAYNDSYGHDMGNKIIDRLADSARQACGWHFPNISREDKEEFWEQDWRSRRLEQVKKEGGAVPFRYGGDEFVVVVLGKRGEKNSGLDRETREVIGKIEEEFNRPGKSNQGISPPGISFGAAHYSSRWFGVTLPHRRFHKDLAAILNNKPRNTKPYEAFIELADQCLYLAKKAGRGRSVVDTQLGTGCAQVEEVLSRDSLVLDKGTKDGLRDTLLFRYEIQHEIEVPEEGAPRLIRLETIDLEIKRSFAKQTVAKIIHGRMEADGIKPDMNILESDLALMKKRIVWVSERPLEQEPEKDKAALE